MKKLTILCSLVLAASVIPNAVACEGKKKHRRAVLEPVREYTVREQVSFRPISTTRFTYRPVAVRKAYWVPSYYSNGCLVGSSWRY